MKPVRWWLDAVRVAVAEFGKPRPNTQRYKLAATGAGVILYRVVDEVTLELLLSVRSAVVGEGYGITGGGFVENGDIAKMPKRTIVETVDEAWRENTEENEGFEKLFPLELFRARAQGVASLHVNTGDESVVHGTNFYAVRVTEAEWEEAVHLAGSDERSGALRQVAMKITLPELSRTEPEQGIQLSVDGTAIPTTAFYHQHEYRAIAMIAWHHQTGKLWRV
jgi:hypothetical protein